MLEAQQLTKRFGGNLALSSGDLVLRPSEVHALVGENGAGKSTLMKILSGVHAPDGGRVLLDGRATTFANPKQAHQAGLVTVFQELSLVPDLSVAENIALGNEPTKWGLPLFSKMVEVASSLLDRVGLRIDPKSPVRTLPVAQRQLVEIARALGKKARFLLLDEPTAVLSRREADQLLSILSQLKRDGVGILYVSHRLPEIYAACEVATVLRDGQTVGRFPLPQTTEDELVRQMVGRSLEGRFVRSARPAGEVRLKVRGLGQAGKLSNIDLAVKAGEVVGLAGLVGAGRTELLRAIFGADPYDRGTVEVDGKVLPRRDPAASVQAGIGFLTEDRKEQGLALQRSVKENATLACLNRFVRVGLVDDSAERAQSERQLEKLDVRANGLDALAASLSGGNQQKVLIGRWLLKGCKVLLFDEPTRGIDVGAKAEIYRLIDELAQEGLAVLVASSDLPEVIGLCDRILVMADGEITGELNGSDATQEAILQLATPRRQAVG